MRGFQEVLLLLQGYLEVDLLVEYYLHKQYHRGDWDLETVRHLIRLQILVQLVPHLRQLLHQQMLLLKKLN
tara:strand:+ start:160 stop:372 length:213 start_codon:yes stop_codon:yes gene_type:complete